MSSPPGEKEEGSMSSNWNMGYVSEGEGSKP